MPDILERVMEVLPTNLPRRIIVREDSDEGTEFLKEEFDNKVYGAIKDFSTSEA